MLFLNPESVALASTPYTLDLNSQHRMDKKINQFFSFFLVVIL